MIDARTLAAAVRTQPGVARLHPGPQGTASTFTADGRVWGIRVGTDAVDVHVVVRPGFAMVPLAHSLADLVAAQIDDPAYAGAVRVHIEDLQIDETSATLAEMSAAPRGPDTPDAQRPTSRVPIAPKPRRNE